MKETRATRFAPRWTFVTYRAPKAGLLSRPPRGKLSIEEIRMRFRIHGDRIVGRVADAAAVGGVTLNPIKSTKELLTDWPAHELPTPALTPNPRVQGRTAEELARSDGGAREFSSSIKETIPEGLSVARILERNRKLWTQDRVDPALANKMEWDALRAMNAANRTFWEAR